MMLIHLVEGCSLRETALRARRGKIVDLSDVAIMDRLRVCEEWFRWMNTQLMAMWGTRQPATVFGHAPHFSHCRWALGPPCSESAAVSDTRQSAAPPVFLTSLCHGFGPG